jgi:hypothetical protein
LDPSFAGGAGYRAIPNPSTAVDAPREKRRGQRVLVDGGGRLRTLVEYPVAAYSGASVLLMRGWTKNGWVDQSFYSGQAKRVAIGSDANTVPRLRAAGIAADSSISLAFTEWDGISYLRLQPNGRQIAARLEKSLGDGTSGGGIDFLPTGAPVVCRTMPDGSSTRLTLLDRGLLQIGIQDGVPLPGSCYDLAIEGSHLWYYGYRYSVGGSNHTVGIARTDLALNSDPVWGQGGYAEMTLPWCCGSVLLGMVDGGAYVWGQGRTRAPTIVRLTSVGELDSAFGSGGVVRLGGTSGLLRNRQIVINAMVADAKGVVASITVRDQAGTEPWRNRLIRLTPDGGLDPLFGKAGIVTLRQQATSLALDAQGRILTLSSVSRGAVFLARRLS